MAAALTIIGVRHHSPACAWLVRETIRELRPAQVLIEGPSDMNDRLDELLAGHQTPIAVFTSYAEEDHRFRSWAPFCDYSPEWVGLREGVRVGARVRFIDLPAWHPALWNRENRYADADRAYAAGIDALCASIPVDNTDALWDHLVEIPPHDGLALRLETYFAGLRSGADAEQGDADRESYMATWVRAGLAHDGPVVVVCGGFHAPAIAQLAREPDDGRWTVDVDGWPVVPSPPKDRSGRKAVSYLVPYSFKRLDSFAGYQSGMPSPAYYQDLWDQGLDKAARQLTERVVQRLRAARQPVSTADLVVARTTSEGLARLRGHQAPGRSDVLDGLAGALVKEPLDVPLPWSRRGTLGAGTDAVVVEMVAALAGDRRGELAAGTPQPPLVADAFQQWEQQDLVAGEMTVDVVDSRERSRVLHRSRVLGVPGVELLTSPDGKDQELQERWRVPRLDGDEVLVALIECGGYGATLADAAAARLEERSGDAQGAAEAAEVLVDAVQCGAEAVSEVLIGRLVEATRAETRLDDLGAALSWTLGLWRHGEGYGLADTTMLDDLLAAMHARTLWLWEGAGQITPVGMAASSGSVPGPGAAALEAPDMPADPGRALAARALRDTAREATGRTETVAVARQLAASRTAPPDVNGAAWGVLATLEGLPGADGAGPGDGLPEITNPTDAMRLQARPETLGDWLYGLLSLARDQLDELLDPLDTTVAWMDSEQFLVALPSLRQAFAALPPREREAVAVDLMARRGLTGSASSFLRVGADPVLVAVGLELDERVTAVMQKWGLG